MMEDARSDDMRFCLIALIVVGLVLAFSVTPAFQATKDSGSENLPKLEVGLGVDCDSKMLTVTATSNETGDAVDGANVYLFYTDYEYQMIGRGTTDADGVGEINVIGKPNYLTALFILRVDKPTYQSKEIEFTYKKCFDAPPKPPKNTTNTTSGGNTTPPANTTQPPNPPANATPPANTTPPGPNVSANTTPPKPPANETHPNNGTPPANNGTGNKPGTSVPPAAPPQAPCLPAILLMPLAISVLSRRG